MLFTPTEFEDLFVISIEENIDDRGFFDRAWCKREFELQGLAIDIVQSNISGNKKSGTLRGFHYQKEPFAEDKIITCLNGKIYDVVIDLRIDSASYLKWKSFYLTPENRKMLFIPAGFAHAYQTLKNNTLILYYSSNFYNPMAEMGIRFNDPYFTIKWPQKIRSISAKDKSWMDFDNKKCPIFLVNKNGIAITLTQAQ
jgi:dTDP-4-dehydrorhamnose 3,5-epimerase